MGKKEKMMQKYIEKKKKQLHRDELFRQINEISPTQNNTSNSQLIKNRVRKNKRKKKKEETFESKIFDESSYNTDESCFSKNEVILNKKYNKNIIDYEKHNIVDDKLINEKHNIVDDKLINEKHNIVDDKLINEKHNINEFINLEYQELLNDNLGEIQLLNNEIDIKLIKDAFIVQRLTKRDVVIQENRKKFEIFYEESEIVLTIKNNLITFIQGNTGCGKTTQIPQFLFEHGFTNNGIIGITQPRRIAAISVCSRINKEMNEKYCGYQIKYENNITDETKIKIMTEGVLIREIQSDFLLSKYSVIILDEVHERTINMDLLIGFLSKIIRIRYENGNVLRLVLMSATANENELKTIFEKYSLIKLNEKRYKVSVFYELNTPEEYLEAIYKKIENILKNEVYKNTIENASNEIVNNKDAGILVFLPSREDIYRLKKQLEETEFDVMVLPLHSNLSKEEQNLVYMKYESRKIVLATNIAETSITINDIVFVVDSGKVKYCIKDSECIKYRIGNISKSSASQRMGRAGRVSNGVCFRIYSSETFGSFRDYNAPEIVTEPTDSMLLQLKAMGIKNIFGFPFITSLNKESISNSIELLQDIGALNEDGNLTVFGKEISKYNIPPIYGYILCMKSTMNIFYYLAVIASILTLNFEVSKNENTKNYFANKKSDLVVFLKIFMDYKKSLNKKQFVKNLGLNLSLLDEINKHTNYLVNIFGNRINSIELDESVENEICRVLYYAFGRHLAVNSGDTWLYKGHDLLISKNSIDVSTNDIVFAYIYCGRNKEYAKGITIINSKWLS